MKNYGLIAFAGLAAAGLFALTAGCEPKDGCASGACMPKAGAAHGKMMAKEVAMDAKQKPDINTAVLSTLLRSGVPVTVLDARTGKYDDGRRIPGAQALSPEASAEEAAKLIPSKESLVVTYCANLHCPASAALAAHLRKLGYKNVLEYPYGIEGWAAADMKVEMAK
jgi:rhodanese-related sulfurtransferase